jgi:hypothetical protein
MEDLSHPRQLLISICMNNTAPRMNDRKIRLHEHVCGPFHLFGRGMYGVCTAILAGGPETVHFILSVHQVIGNI